MRFLEEMKARSVQPVQLLDRMMDSMQPPESRALMRSAMKPVTEKINDQHHEDRLNPNRPGMRPQGGNRQVERTGGGDERICEHESHQRRKRELHDGHELEVES